MDEWMEEGSMCQVPVMGVLETRHGNLQVATHSVSG